MPLRPAVFFRSILILASLVFIHSGAAEMYRWVDDKGQVHFSDRPQKEGKSEKIAPPDVNIGESVKVPRNVKRRLPEANSSSNASRAKTATELPMSQEDCSAVYGMTCDRVFNWERYARDQCEADREGRRCNDATFLKNKYKPRTLEYLRKKSAYDACNRRNRNNTGVCQLNYY